MAKNITLDSLTNADPTAPGIEQDRGEFKAETLVCTITTADGDEVCVVEMDARAFKPNDKGLGGCGWYASLGKGKATFRGVPVSGGFRLSVAGLKIGAGDKVDLNPADDS